MTFAARILRRLRDGTLLDVVNRRLGRLPMAVRVRWFGARSEAEGVDALAQWGRQRLRGAAANDWVLSLGDGDAFHQQLDRRLASSGTPFRSAGLDSLCGWSAERLEGLRAILAAYPDARRQTAAARTLAAHPRLGEIPFEYVSGLNRERGVFTQLDEYAETHFVSPVLLDQPSPYELYEESLRHFEQKCGLRDYLDLYQMLKTVIENRVPGDIAEFGSYRGHSGWLIARTLQALGSDKRLFMFDMFEAFPAESYGVDHFWSRTHTVDFAQVRDKLREFSHVRLVKGDFTKTLADSALDAVALAYVDCDSYRATRFLFDTLWPSRLSPGGALVCEDYGHPALLGSRAAVYESVERLPGCVRFFSQFSGLYICVKTAVP